YHRREEILAFQRILLEVLLEEQGESLFELLQDACREAPHIHGDDAVYRNVRESRAVILRIRRSVSPLLDMGPLLNSRQISVFIRFTYAPRHMPVLGEGIAQNISYHGIAVFVVVLMG